MKFWVDFRDFSENPKVKSWTPKLKKLFLFFRNPPLKPLLTIIHFGELMAYVWLAVVRFFIPKLRSNF